LTLHRDLLEQARHLAMNLKDLLARRELAGGSAERVGCRCHQIEGELQGGEHIATQEGQQIIDTAMASMDAGESVSPVEIKAVFAKYRRA
jgi:hypothetical protein